MLVVSYKGTCGLEPMLYYSALSGSHCTLYSMYHMIERKTAVTSALSLLTRSLPFSASVSVSVSMSVSLSLSSLNLSSRLSFFSFSSFFPLLPFLQQVYYIAAITRHILSLMCLAHKHHYYQLFAALQLFPLI